jgi:hypothetical protein
MLKVRVFYSVLMLLGVVALETVRATAQVRPSTNPQSTVLSNKKEASCAAAYPALPSCSSTGLTPIQPLPLGTGHHKVILSWHASAPSNNAEISAIGYCVYRRKEKKKEEKKETNAAKQKPTCDDYEQVNLRPIAVPGCADDLVEDDVKYYYVVTAINSKGTPSSFSNEVAAVIPVEKQISSITAPPPLSCREKSQPK